MKRLRRSADLKKVLTSALFMLILSVSSAGAFEVRAEPSVIMPGDAFLVRVSGVNGSVLPEAVFGGRQLSFGSCGQGCFVAIGAADINAATGKKSMTVKIGDKTKRLPLTIKRHAYPVISLTLPEGKVSLSEEDLERVNREDRLLKSFWTKQSEQMWQGSFIMPLDNEISTQFGIKRIINKSKESIHRGIDMRGREGEEVRASNSGKVVVADELFFGGNTLLLDHGRGIYTVYMHLSGFSRKTGDTVAKGDIIGFVGSTGRSTGPHLHFGVKASELSVNPVSFAKLKL